MKPMDESGTEGGGQAKHCTRGAMRGSYAGAESEIGAFSGEMPGKLWREQ